MVVRRARSQLSPNVASCGRRASKFPVRAIVFGHVILALSDEELKTIGPHERVHVAQYEHWGPLFLLAYGASSFWQLINGRSPYWHNYFEVQAREQSSQSCKRGG